MNNTVKFTLSLIGVFSAFMLVAQPPAPPATPIDGGLSLLLAGSAVYGIKKVMDTRKK